MRLDRACWRAGPQCVDHLPRPETHPGDRNSSVRRNDAVHDDEDGTLTSRQRALSLPLLAYLYFSVLYYCSGLLVQP